jgi:hypothetical protein
MISAPANSLRGRATLRHCRSARQNDALDDALGAARHKAAMLQFVEQRQSQQ